MKSTKSFCIIVIMQLLLCFSWNSGLAQEWSQWRGPDRDGVVAVSEIPETWPGELKLGWQIDVGEGHSSPVVAGGKIYIFSRQGDEEVVSCVNPEDGRILWRESSPAPYTMHPAATGHGKGPKSTPVVAEGAVVTLGISGILSCHDATDGTLRWRKSFEKDFKATSPAFGAAMSPIVFEGLCIAHVGGNDDGALVAVDLSTGKTKWKWTDDGPGYASPIIATFDGSRQVVTFAQEHIIGIDVNSGKLLWQIPFVTPWKVSCVTPILFENDLILTGYEQGTMRVRVVKEGSTWSTEKMWHNADFGTYMNTPVLFGNLLVALADRRKGQYGILDVESGQLKWQGEGRQGENAALIRAGERLLSLHADGKFIVAEIEDHQIKPLKTYTVADSPTWAHPVFFDKKMLIKAKTTLSLWELGD